MKKDKELLRVGVLGAGLIAQAAHLKARNVELYALCDAAPDLLGKVAAIFEPKTTFSDYDALLAGRGVDAVVVAITDQFHVAMATKALEAGKHVLIEKPMGIHVDECERLRDIAHAHPGLHVQVGTMRRFDPGIAFAHEFIRHEIAELLALKAWYCDSVYRYQETDNLHPLIHTGTEVRDIFFGLLRSVGFDGPLIMHGFDEDEALESTHFARAKLREANANVLH